MLRKITLIVITTLALTANVNAGSDGELILKKNNPSEIANGISQKYFKNNRKIESLIIKNNIEFLKKNSEDTIYWINNSSSKTNYSKKVTKKEEKTEQNQENSGDK